MKHTQDEILIAQEIVTPTAIFRMEEYWEEDDSGFCCVDYVLAKHTRLHVLTPDGTRTLKLFDFDGLEYEKSMTLQGDELTVTYHPEVDREVTRVLHVPTLQVLS